MPGKDAGVKQAMKPVPSSAPLFVCLAIGFGLGFAVAVDRNPSPGWRERSTRVANTRAHANLPGAPVASPLPLPGSSLGSDNPEIRRRQEKFVQQTAQRLAADRRPGYAALFDRWGISSAAYQGIVEHEALVSRAKIKANLAQGEFAQVQADYDQRIKRLLGERFTEYLAYEKGVPTRTELGEFLRFAQEKQIILTDGDKLAFEAILTELGPSVRSLVEWGGPYQGIPKVYAGNEVLPFLIAQHEDLLARANQINRQVAQRNELSEPAAFALKAFYQEQLKLTANLVDHARDPLAKRRRMLTEELAALKATPDPNQKEIKHVEKLIEAAMTTAIR